MKTKEDIFTWEYQKILVEDLPLALSHQVNLKNLIKKFPPPHGTHAGTQAGTQIECKVLELGAGPASIFIDMPGFKVCAIEQNREAYEYARKYYSRPHIHYHLQDLCKLAESSNAMFETPFDLILDAHCLHFLTCPAHRKKVFSYLCQKLNHGGSLYAEMMILGKAMKFVEPFRYCDISNVLFYKEIPYSYIPDARHLEHEILSYGFNIFYFYIMRGQKFVIDKRNFGDGNIGNCDCVEMILKRA